MKRIRKTHPPPELTAWLKANQETNHSYDDLRGTDAHRALKSKLLKEQGWLCAYTGQRIDRDSSHVEHIKPQDKCGEWEDVDYRNVVACFPAEGGDVSHGYGAPVKDNWWDEEKFISPLTEECERRFRFAWSGHIHPDPDTHDCANETIEKLRLDADSLRKLRKKRIDGFFGFGPRTCTRPLSVAEAKIALANIDCQDHNGKLQEFCFVLRQLLPKYIEKAGEKL